MFRSLPKKTQVFAGFTCFVSGVSLTGCIGGAGGGGTTVTGNSTPVTPLAQIVSVSPGWITQGSTQPVTITLTGQNFTRNATVLLDQSVGSPGDFTTTYVSPTQLTATLSTSILSQPQMFSVSVDQPTTANSVGYSNAINFFVMSANPRTDPSLVPSVSTIYGSPVTAGAQNWLLQMSGENLSTNATIEVNGSARTTEIGGDGVHIDEVWTTDFQPSEIAMAGNLQIVVISDPMIAPSGPTVLPIVPH